MDQKLSWSELRLQTLKDYGEIPEVIVRELPDDYPHAKSIEDLDVLFRTGLEHDLALHAGRQYALPDVAGTIIAQQRIKFYKHMSLVIIRNNKISVKTLSPSGTAPSPTPKRVQFTVQGLKNATETGVKLPDSVFLLNTWDEPRCHVRRPHTCLVPVLSLIKGWDPNHNTTLHKDILVPFFNHYYQTIMDYPWSLKKPQALMRAAIQNGMAPNSTRVALVRMVDRHRQTSPDSAVSRLLDVGITANNKEGLTDVQVVPQVAMTDHAKWRYLISADGTTASCRFGKLLGINSLILKERSRWIEHYYRALETNKHYMTFTKLDIETVLRHVESKTIDQMEEMAKRAQQFQQFYLTQHAKALYFAHVLEKYNALFAPGVMSEFVSSLDSSRMDSLEYLMQQLSKAGAADTAGGA